MLIMSLLLVAALHGGFAGMPARTDAGQAVVQVQAAAEEAVALSGTAWLLTFLEGHDVDPEIGSSLEFDDSGAVFGNGGCNRFRGAVETEGSTLKFGELASTMMACEEPNSKQEAAFHAALEATVGFRIEATTLVLLNAADTVVARLSPAP